MQLQYIQQAIRGVKKKAIRVYFSSLYLEISMIFASKLFKNWTTCVGLQATTPYEISHYPTHLVIYPDFYNTHDLISQHMRAQ